MSQPSALVILAYATVAVGALIGSVLLADPWGALLFILGVIVAAVAFLTLVWSRVDMEAVLRVIRRNE